MSAPILPNVTTKALPVISSLYKARPCPTAGVLLGRFPARRQISLSLRISGTMVYKISTPAWFDRVTLYTAPAITAR
jgi:hypothetical protein